MTKTNMITNPPLENIHQSSNEATPQHTIVSLLERTHAEEQFGTVEASASFLKGLNYDQFESFLNRANGLCRSIPSSRRNMDGRGHIEEQSEVLGWSRLVYTPPQRADRRPLLQEAFEKAQETKDLERVATMLGLIINIVHPYEDGNGRTSRLLYGLLSHGYDGSADDKQYFNDLLQNTEGRKTVDLNPQRESIASRFSNYRSQNLAKEEGYDGPVPTYGFGGYHVENVEDRSAGELVVSDVITPSDRNKLHSILADKDIQGTVFFDFLLKNRREEISDYLKDYGNRCLVLLDKLVPELSSHDIQILEEIQTATKKEYARTVIDMLTKPEWNKMAAFLVDAYRPKQQEN